MWRSRWWLRLRQSRGYGIHSPFAYDLITNVIYARYDYYAFYDIAQSLRKNGLHDDATAAFNRLSFRLINYFNAKHILEVNSGKGVNTCYLTAPASDIWCTCVEKEGEKVAVAKKLHSTAGCCEYVTTLPPSGSVKYDAIFINLKEREVVQGATAGQKMQDEIDVQEYLSIETLLPFSHEKTFWVIHSLKSRRSKHFWSAIVKDERFSVTFDIMKKVGIAFLRPSFHKVHYFV